jgi:WD repeat-containing protein 48
VLSGGVIQSYGKVDLVEKEKELFEPRSVPSWFTTDIRLGQISIWLEPPSCFLSEEYALDLGYLDAPDDQKINMGRLVLEGILAKWKYHLILEDTQRRSGQQVSSQDQASSSAISEQVKSNVGSGGGAVLPPFTYSDSWPKYWEQGAGLPPAVVSSFASGAPWRLLASSFTGKELDPDMLPSWVVEAVLRGSNVIPKESKLAFILVPEVGSDMPSLMQSKLNAPRILQVHKVASYCLTKLQELNIHLELKPQYLKRPLYAPPSPPTSSPPVSSDNNTMMTNSVAGGNGNNCIRVGSVTKGHVLELLCNGMAVPYEMSLASVKKFIWRKSEDIVFTFRVQDAQAPMPLPVLTGPP